jgi:hypothetical protein
MAQQLKGFADQYIKNAERTPDQLTDCHYDCSRSHSLFE